VPIQRRDDRRLSTRLPLDLSPSADAPEPLLDEVFEDRPPTFPPDPDAPAVCDSGAVVVVCTAAATGAGSFGIVGSGAGEDGALGGEGAGAGEGEGTGKGLEGTVIGTVGTGGTGGRTAAAAAPASTAVPARANNPPRTRISEQLPPGRKGSARGRIGNNQAVAVVKRDYYEVLGVARDADAETIRRAFYGLARDWHPDTAEVPDAEGRFRELAEAYSVLSKREARLLYDRYGYRGRGNQGSDEALWEAGPVEVNRGEDIHLELELRSFEAEKGTRPVVAFPARVRCVACMGRGSIGSPDSEGEPCPRCEGSGTVEAERRLRLRIPPGLADDTRLRVKGDGSDAGADSLPGDLFVRVHVLPPPKDPRMVRYMAFALLLIAIAALAVYVIR
jgi:molecular chaperone DnaJ